MKTVNTVTGYPYIGAKRQWKRILEKYWKNDLVEASFEAELKALRLERLQHQQQLGLQLITVGDFTQYDRMLDLATMFNLIPSRYAILQQPSEKELYYAMARGAKEVVACEMTKWFNTNYHYIVPEYEGQSLHLTHNLLLEQFNEAKNELGILTKPTIIGPYTFVDLAKGYDEKTRAIFFLQLIPLYSQIINELTAAGAEWIQFEEPSFTKNLPEEEIAIIEQIYGQINEATPNAKIVIQTYFEALPFFERLTNLPVAGIGLDFVHGQKENMKSLQNCGFPKNKLLSIGIVNGRDIWASNLAEAVAIIQSVQQLSAAEELWISSSCSLQHVPVSKKTEENLPKELYHQLAFADEKIEEIVQLTHFIEKGIWLKEGILKENLLAIETLATHPIRKNKEVTSALNALKSEDFQRQIPYSERQKIQKAALQLPDFPTTTIGSFPQSQTVKKTRTAWRKQLITPEQYEQFIQQETARWITIQEEIGLDVLVHGEFERTDMVEYFGEHLTGFAFTQYAWVVSYGSRCVKPPIIYGDVQWNYAMTVKEVADAQQLTKKYVKGMLTGPITILNWSFVRNDLPRQEVAYQIGLAIREEIQALEQAGIKIIQVDEPALREGLPLRKENWATYLDWAVNAFKLSTSAVAVDTQIHTHMCYCEFNDFIDAIRALDADVISLETSRSHGGLIDSLKDNPYELGVGLGVYDIHSPRVPAVEEISHILEESLAVIPKEQFWINPDCGLKTRGEEETIASLINMVTAAQQLRAAKASVTH